MVKRTPSQCPKWSPEDETALVKEYDALRAAGLAWAEAFVLPSGRTLTAAQARNRRSHLKMSCVKRRRVVEPDPKSDTAPPRAKRKRRRTPMKKRADAAGVLYAPTPIDLRAIVDDPSASLAVRDEARKAINRHQHARMYRVKTAETHNQTELVRQKLALCERASAGRLCKARRMLKIFLRARVAVQASINFNNPPDLMQLSLLARMLTSHLWGERTPDRHRRAASAFMRAVSRFTHAEYKRRLSFPLPPLRGHRRGGINSLVASVGIYTNAVRHHYGPAGGNELQNLTPTRATSNYNLAVNRFVDAIEPPGPETEQAAAVVCAADCPETEQTAADACAADGPETEQAAAAAYADDCPETEQTAADACAADCPETEQAAVDACTDDYIYAKRKTVPSDHRPVIITFATAVGVFAAALVSEPLRRRHDVAVARRRKKRTRALC